MLTTKKILIIGPAWVGDMIMSQTLYKFIKQNNPDAVIDVIAPKATCSLLSFMPEVRKAILFEGERGKLNFWQRFRLAKQLRVEKYDQAIITPNSFKSAFIPFFAKIKQRTGWLGEQRYGLLNDYRLLDKQKYPLMIERFAALAIDAKAAVPTSLPYPKFTVNEDQVTEALKKLNITLTNKPVLALCPGAEFGPAKRWPAEYYAEIAKQKLAEGWDIWLFGSPKESDAAKLIQIVTNNACVDLVGKTNLIEAITIMSKASAVVCNDSGLMHVAAALNKPLVVVYGSSSPKFTPPLSKDVKILSLNLDCSPCFKRECPLGHLNCLKHLMPERVLHALNDL